MPSIKIKNKITNQWEKLPIFQLDAGGGTGDYEELENKPSINGVELIGNKTTANLGLFSGNYNDLSNKPTIPTVPTDVSAFNNDADYQTGTDVSTAVGAETTNRQTADTALQSQIDALANANDVVDVLATYQNLLDYDTTHLKNNDIIKVMSDSTHSNAISYFKWVIAENIGAWSYVGSQGPFYTKSETDTLLNAKANTSDIPTELADLAGDSTHRTVTDAEKTTWNSKQNKYILGISTDYSSSEPLNINNLDEGIYEIKSNTNGETENIYIKGTYNNITVTRSITNIRLFNAGTYTLQVLNKLTDELSTGTTFAILYYLIKYDSETIRCIKQLIKTSSTAGIQFTAGSFGGDVNYVNPDGQSNINGKKIFTILPESSVTPTTDNQLVNKKYVDDTVGDINTALENINTILDNIINGGA